VSPASVSPGETAGAPGAGRVATGAVRAGARTGAARLAGGRFRSAVRLGCCLGTETLIVGSVVEVAGAAFAGGAFAGAGALLWAHTLHGTSNAATSTRTRGMNFPRRRVHAEQSSVKVCLVCNKARGAILGDRAKFSAGVTFAPRLCLKANAISGWTAPAGGQRCADRLALLTCRQWNEGDPRWLGQLRPSSKSASASRSTAICRRNSKRLERLPPGASGDLGNSLTGWSSLHAGSSFCASTAVFFCGTVGWAKAA
jgi:hypothetical protein